VQTTLRCLRTPAPPLVPAIVLSVKPLADIWLVREAESAAGEVYDRKEDAIARAPARSCGVAVGAGCVSSSATGFIEREFEMQRGTVLRPRSKG
jgi:hypothetical protein